MRVGGTIALDVDFTRDICIAEIFQDARTWRERDAGYRT